MVTSHSAIVTASFSKTYFIGDIYSIKISFAYYAVNASVGLID